MKYALSILAFCICTAVMAQEETVFILVRHAEKETDGTRDPNLNEEGLKRAKLLATMLERQDVTSIYSTSYNRTKQTVAPLAKQKGLSVGTYEPRPSNEWLVSLFKGGHTVVISGHSNTIPQIANQLLGEERFSDFSEKDYSNLIILTGTALGKTRLVYLTY